ncbi:MAG: tRNA (adenosine(37)-N6)-threonylcarbamoyltransferase complex ATPase subunit type 1 TsaE [Planctomycetes bacterium]|nr:tRNA (adenosine(37)-N6)-threonylcarbamoyltransferase complex ATPase subunit type 1 TsaE [Planctomycetota bacterium]
MIISDNNDKFTIVSESVEDTFRIGKNLARAIGPPAVVALVGDLGVGKTAFVKGFASGLGVKSEITSPTFTLMNSYTSDSVKLYHIDAYRLKGGAAGLIELGFEDLSAPDSIIIIEWAEQVKDILPLERILVTIDHPSGDMKETDRAISIDSEDSMDRIRGAITKDA